MSWNGTGVFQRLYSWVTEYGNGLPINPSHVDGDTNDIVTGLNNCLTRDAQGEADDELRLCQLQRGESAERGQRPGCGDVLSIDYQVRIIDRLIPRRLHPVRHWSCGTDGAG